MTTTSSKLVELIILTKLHDYVSTKNYQLGFKSGHATDSCIYALKQVIDYYLKFNSPVFIYFFRY